MAATPEHYDSHGLHSALAWDPVLKPLGYQKISSLSSAVGLTPPAAARVAMIQAEGEAVRYRDDGTDPTSTTGMKLANGDSIWFNADLSVVKFIEVTGGASLNILYYGTGDVNFP